MRDRLTRGGNAIAVPRHTYYTYTHVTRGSTAADGGCNHRPPPSLHTPLHRGALVISHRSGQLSITLQMFSNYFSPTPAFLRRDFYLVHGALNNRNFSNLRFGSPRIRERRSGRFCMYDDLSTSPSGVAVNAVCGAHARNFARDYLTPVKANVLTTNEKHKTNAGTPASFTFRF